MKSTFQENELQIVFDNQTVEEMQHSPMMLAIHQKKSFHNQESNTTILSEYIVRLISRHHQFLLK